MAAYGLIIAFNAAKICQVVLFNVSWDSLTMSSICRLISDIPSPLRDKYNRYSILPAGPFIGEK